MALSVQGRPADPRLRRVRGLLSRARRSRRIRASVPDLRALFVSGYAGNAISERDVLAPGTHFLQKPVTPDSLVRHVRAALDR